MVGVTAVLAFRKRKKKILKSQIVKSQLRVAVALTVSPPHVQTKRTLINVVKGEPGITT